jgi:N-acetyl-anhydromuramyl-L-alanine amidase AmpD
MHAEDVEYLVVHTAAFPHRNCDRDLIDRWHRERGWSGIGYHFVIINDLHDELDDGTVQTGRPVHSQGAHALGVNERSLGICCVGHGDREPHTDAQRASLLRLLSDLMDEHPNVTVDGVIGHRELNDLVEEGVLAARYRTSKTCPGTKVDMDEIRSELRTFRRGEGPSEPEGPAPSDADLKEALEVLGRVPGTTFSNAHDELRAFLRHPEVVAFQED